MSFITPAYAQTAAGGSSSFTMLLPLLLIFVIMYFLIIRPQRAQMKKHQEMINAVRRGDNVVTGGGFIGKVTKVFDDSGEVEVELADNVRVRVLRSTLTSVRNKTEISTEKGDKNASKKADGKNRGNKQEKAADENTSEVEADDAKPTDEVAVNSDQTTDQKSDNK